jgi:hypothetical protein
MVGRVRSRDQLFYRWRGHVPNIILKVYSNNNGNF